MSFPSLRPRVPGYNHTGGISRIIAGTFGSGAPSMYNQVDVDPRSVAPVIYAYHRGDVFEPGAEGFVFEPLQELPLKSWWGGGSDANQGTPYPVNAWPVFASAIPIVSIPAVTRQGYGGLQAGAFVQQPLLDSESDNG